MPKVVPPVPVAARRVLARLGADIGAARRRRRLPLAIVAERALTTRQTVARIERGDPRVAMGTWASVLFVLGLVDRLGEVADPGRDEVGLAIAAEQLPRVARLPRATSRGARSARSARGGRKGSEGRT